MSDIAYPNSRAWLAEPQQGIPVDADGNPLDPTIVFTASRREFELFCHACRINPDSPNVMYLPTNELSPFKQETAQGREIDSAIITEHALNLKKLPWKHVVFLGVNPASYYASYYASNYETGWHDLEEMRRNKQFTRAFQYERTAIKPDIQGRTR